MKKSGLIFVLSVILVGCSSSEQVELDPYGENVYISNGVEQYYMTELPYWANFSMIGGCFRQKVVRYLNFEKMNQSYGMNYFQLVNMQYMLNKKFHAYKSSSGQKQLSPRDESFIFHNTYQKIVGGGSDFIIPKYKKISLIEVDEILSVKGKLKQVLQNKHVKLGYPILVSRCYSFYELEELIQSIGLDGHGLKYISSEMFSIFDKDLKKLPRFDVDYKSFFKNKSLTLFKLGRSQKEKNIKVREIKR